MLQVEVFIENELSRGVCNPEFSGERAEEAERVVPAAGGASVAGVDAVARANQARLNVDTSILHAARPQGDDGIDRRNTLPKALALSVARLRLDQTMLRKQEARRERGARHRDKQSGEAMDRRAAHFKRGAEAVGSKDRKSVVEGRSGGGM